MRNSSNTPQENPNKSRYLLKLAATVAICATLGSCSTSTEKIQKQEERVAELTYELEQQAKNYHEVARQQNIQIDLRNEWADATINQEIGYSTDRGNDYDKKIAKTKKKLAKAQKKLAKLKEEYNVTTTSNPNYDKLNPTKYDYIPEEYERSKK